MSVYDKIRNGDYATKLPSPTRPGMPPLLARLARTLTDDEIRILPQVKAEYDAASLAYRDAISMRRADASRLEHAFRDDMEDEFGMAGHPKADKLYELAYTRGGSDGWEAILAEYETLADLVKAA